MIPSRIHIIEVGPRDGLQNEKAVIPLEAKFEFIRLLSRTGIEEIEAGAFVSPKWVPQMADSAALFDRIRTEKMNPDVTYSALVPNEKGMESALQCGVKKIAVFTAASETFNQKNINCSIAESIARFKPVLKIARDNGVKVRGYVSTAFVCPYEGEIDPERVRNVLEELRQMGIEDLSIGDTIGKATPSLVQSLLEYLIVKHSFLNEILAMHFHDTYGNAWANVEASLKFGINRFDASAAGLGGCPYAPGAAGNVATELLVSHFHGMGIATGIDETKLAEAVGHIRRVLPHKV